ncbi:hypothetical protein PRK78_003077 [Emydomyces testavorans]|uniref:Uncharacterized protein n=1 Tax=Emydomyces testavorans TaxID=2070801 RepID=A0AAF0IH48_9EURO|nr:hypothetical protein PRK78_003077 [Emydomyces testavorans]
MAQERFTIINTFYQPSPGVQPGYFYRIKTADGTYKYLHANDSASRGIDRKGQNLGFNTVPKGNWVVGKLARTEKSKGKYMLVSTSTAPLKGIERPWNQNLVDVLDLNIPSYPFGESDDDESLAYTSPESEHLIPLIDEIRCRDHFGVPSVVAYVAHFPDVVHSLEREAEIYRLIQGKGIGRPFVGYITENKNRIVGIMIEDTAVHHFPMIATPDHVKPCQAVLAKLHGLGIALGTVRPEAFLILTDGQALINSFDTCTRNASREVLDQEMKRVPRALQSMMDPMNLSKELKMQLQAISDRDGALHPVVINQALMNGRITITQQEHRKLLAEPPKGVRAMSGCRDPLGI